MMTSIKAKLTLSLTALILIPFLIVSAIIGIQVQNNSIDDFKKSSENEIKQFEQYVSLFFNGIKNNVESISSFPELINIPGNLKTYHQTTVRTPAFPDPENQTQMKIFNFLSTILKGQSDYAVIYVGAKDSGFIKSPKGMAGAGYNPVKRGWYSEAISANGEISISKAYRSTSGESVIAVAKELKGFTGERIGVLGIDISLKALTNTIQKIKIGKSGHIVMVQGDGTVLANPSSPETNFKKMSELENESYKTMANVESGFMEVTLNNKRQFANVYTSKDKKWKYIAVIDKDEVTASAHRIVKMIILIGLCIVAISIAVGQFMASKLSKQLLGITKKLKSASQEVSVVSEELLGVATTFSDSARQQASSVEETSASLEEVSGMVRNNAEKAQVTVDQIEEVSTMTKSANSSMNHLSNSMHEILKSNKQIEDLVCLIENIADKTAIMDEIVFQTKLLSFNASVEAERAGEHGRGFAVVAQEVGNLAQMSGDAAKEISQIVKSSIESTRDITSNNTKRVVEGEEYLKETTESFSSISESNSLISDGAQQILVASKEQKLGVEQITTAMEMLDSVTQQSSYTADKTAETGKQLLTQSELMNAIVSELTRIVTGKEDQETLQERIEVERVHANNVVEIKRPVREDDQHWEAI